MFIKIEPDMYTGGHLFKDGKHTYSEIGTSQSFFKSLSKTIFSKKETSQPLFIIGSGERKIEIKITSVTRVTERDFDQLLDNVFDFSGEANLPFDKDFMKKEFIPVKGRVNFNKL